MKENNLYKQLEANKVIPKYGDKMTIEEFIGYCKEDLLLDYDGFGYPALKDKMNSDITLTPSKVLNDEYDKRYTHIIWFNR